MTNKELDIKACKTFVCPNLNLIVQKGKELGLKYTTIERAKSMSIEYFKKTYHKPRYSSAKLLLPSFLYVASILEGERRSQTEVADIFGTTTVTIKKWNKDIVAVLGINIDYRDWHRGKDRGTICVPFVCPDLGPIDKIGKALELRDDTIDKAKELCVRYLNAARQKYHCRHIEYIFSASIYVGAIIKSDKRTQMDISNVSKIQESNISIYSRDIIETLGIKIIYGFNDRVISVSEEGS